MWGEYTPYGYGRKFFHVKCCLEELDELKSIIKAEYKKVIK